MVLGYICRRLLRNGAVGCTCWCWIAHAGVAPYMMAFGSNEGVGFETLVLVVHAGVQLKMSVLDHTCWCGPYIVMLGCTRWRFLHRAWGHGERMIMAVKKGWRRTKYGHWCLHLLPVHGAGGCARARLRPSQVPDAALRNWSVQAILGLLILWSVVNGREMEGPEKGHTRSVL